MTPYLKTSVLKFLDLSEQPESKYVLLLQGGNVVPQVSVAVDYINVTPDAIDGFRDGEASACVTIPAGMEYGLFRRDTFRVLTREEAIRLTHDQITALKSLRKELDPSGAADEEMAAALERHQLAHMHKQVMEEAGSLSSQTPSTGVYI